MAYSPRINASRNATTLTCSFCSDVDASRVITRRGNTMLLSSAQAALASPSSVSLPAPLGPTTRTSRPASPAPRDSTGLAPLIVDIEADGAEQHQPLDHLLVVDADAENGHAVVH